jgi:hypothetical protein
MPKSTRCAAVACFLTLTACVGAQRAYAPTDSALKLSRVVLYRNGVAYFERTGVVNGDSLTLKVRKDHINDLLKSLTVIDRSSGKPLSVSIPLDPRVWQDAALAMLMPGHGRLAEVLDALRGTPVVVDAGSRRVRGRIVMVERVPLALDPKRGEGAPSEDHKLTLLDGDVFELVTLSNITAIRLAEGDLVMQLERHLDASAGEGMFQQVEIVAHFADAGEHDLAVSYVADAPLWKPTYRLVLPDDASGKALLQAWAVVSNVTGENWDAVQLALTSGAPLAFRYDLHTPQDVERPDLTQSGVDKHAQVSFGETSVGSAAGAAPPAPPPMAAERERDEVEEDVASAPQRSVAPLKKERPRAQAAAPAAPVPAKPAPAPSAIDLPLMAAMQAPQASAKQVAGLTRFDIAERVSLPDGSASMVQLVNQLVPAEEVFLYKPGGAGQGYEWNPYRVIRFENATDFVLEPGPISIYAGGSFVGEGLSEAIGSREHATIPFAVEPSIIVHMSGDASGEAMKITRIVRDVIEVQSFRRNTTRWSVTAKPAASARRVLVRQPRAGVGFSLIDPPEETETLPDAYLLPIVLAPKATSAELNVVEQTPAKLSLDIWDERAPELLQQLMAAPEIDANARATLQPVVDARAAIGRIDGELSGLQAQQEQLDERAEEERQNLLAIQKDPRAAALRKRLSQRLEALTQEAAELGRKIVELNRQRMEKKIELEDRLRELDFSAGS